MVGLRNGGGRGKVKGDGRILQVFRGCTVSSHMKRLLGSDTGSLSRITPSDLTHFSKCSSSSFSVSVRPTAK